MQTCNYTVDIANAMYASFLTIPHSPKAFNRLLQPESEQVSQSTSGDIPNRIINLGGLIKTRLRGKIFSNSKIRVIAHVNTSCGLETCD
jgi:hypothetical protein